MVRFPFTQANLKLAINCTQKTCVQNPVLLLAGQWMGKKAIPTIFSTGYIMEHPLISSTKGNSITLNSTVAITPPLSPVPLFCLLTNPSSRHQRRKWQVSIWLPVIGAESSHHRDEVLQFIELTLSPRLFSSNTPKRTTPAGSMLQVLIQLY